VAWNYLLRVIKPSKRKAHWFLFYTVYHQYKYTTLASWYFAYSHLPTYLLTNIYNMRPKQSKRNAWHEQQSSSGWPAITAFDLIWAYMTFSDFVTDGAHDVWGNGDAARDHCQNDHRCRQCLALALRYSMNIPAEKSSVRF